MINEVNENSFLHLLSAQDPWFEITKHQSVPETYIQYFHLFRKREIRKNELASYTKNFKFFGTKSQSSWNQASDRTIDSIYYSLLSYSIIFSEHQTGKNFQIYVYEVVASQVHLDKFIIKFSIIKKRNKINQHNTIKLCNEKKCMGERSLGNILQWRDYFIM